MVIIPIFSAGSRTFVDIIKSMQDRELNDFILKRLVKSHSRDEILVELCETNGFSWGEADAKLEYVQAENESAIARSQFPILFIIATIFFITGLLLTGYGVYGLTLLFSPGGGIPNDLTTYFIPVIEVGLDPFQIFLVLLPAYFKFLAYLLFNPVSAAMFGIAMIVGSLLGMRNSWTEILGRL